MIAAKLQSLLPLEVLFAERSSLAARDNRTCFRMAPKNNVKMMINGYVAYSIPRSHQT